MVKYSERAKKNTRDGINLRIGVIETRIEGIKKEIRLYERLAHTIFARRVLTALKRKLIKRKSQLTRYLRRKVRLKKEGKI